MFGSAKAERLRRTDDRVLFTIEADADDLIRIHMDGIWTVADTEAFFAKLRPIDTAVRARKGFVHALVECKSVQSPMIVLRMRTGILSIAEPTDRIAIVYDSILSKLQILRVTTGSGIFATFCDTRSARAWLQRT